ncbi:MAG TPA: hypothetical protein VIY30_17895, partial [Burkholderiaceae bacterium]
MPPAGVRRIIIIDTPRMFLRNRRILRRACSRRWMPAAACCISLAVAAVAAVPGVAHADIQPTRAPYAPRQILVKYTSATPSHARAAVARAAGAGAGAGEPRMTAPYTRLLHLA